MASKKVKKAFVYVAACQKRALDARKVSNYFLKNNYKIINRPSDADVIFYITCGYSQQEADKAFNKIKEFQKYDAELVVAGCVPGTDKEKLAKIFNGKIIVTRDLDKIDNLFPDHEVKFEEIIDPNIEYDNQDEATRIAKDIKTMKKISKKLGPLGTVYFKIEDFILKNIIGQHSYLYKSFAAEDPVYTIRISWGCYGNCSYCAIKKAIGRLKSKPLDQIIREFKCGLAEGAKYFALAADDVGLYGLDIKSSFAELLDEMTKIPGDYEISLGSLDPRWAVRYADDIGRILKRDKIKLIGIPFQSGNPRVLKLMCRYADVEKMKDAIKKIYETFPNVSLNTHIIVGFPTETMEEFKDSLNLIKDGNFSAGLVFLYSEKPGTEAEKIEPKIPMEEIDKRLKFAKKFLNDAGYNVIHIKKPHFFQFDKT